MLRSAPRCVHVVQPFSGRRRCGRRVPSNWAKTPMTLARSSATDVRLARCVSLALGDAARGNTGGEVTDLLSRARTPPVKEQCNVNAETEPHGGVHDELDDGLDSDEQRKRRGRIRPSRTKHYASAHRGAQAVPAELPRSPSAQPSQDLAPRIGPRSTPQQPACPIRARSLVP